MNGTRLRRALSGFDRGFFLQAFKITASATAAWGLALILLPGTKPIYAPITACFIAVATVRATFQDAAQRVIAVITGIALAYFVGSALGLHIWTVTVMTGLGVLLGRALRLPRPAAAQVPISGLLIMAIGATAGNAGERVMETLIGAGVSVLINLVILPPNHVVTGSRAVAGLLDGLAGAMTTMSAGITRPWVRADAAGWLELARANGPVAEAAEDAVGAGADSLRLRPASAQYVADQSRVEAAMDTLRVVEIQVRVVARSLRDYADAMTGPDGPLSALPMTADLLAATSQAISAFGGTALERDEMERPSAAARTRRLLDAADRTVEAINLDLADMTAANLRRGLHLGTLVLEAHRVVDELRAGLDRIAPATAPEAA